MVISEEKHFDPKGYPSLIFCNIKMLTESACLPGMSLSMSASVEDTDFYSWHFPCLPINLF